MITEEMIARATTGEIVYFRDEDENCYMLWIRRGTIRVVPLESGNCPT